jgi:molybdopterin synthase catalytic subunit
MIQAAFTKDPISIQVLLDGVSESFHGAQVIFTGAVRTPNQGKTVLGVSYDAFEPLATRTLELICGNAEMKWGPGLSIRRYHLPV